eukprot:584291-Hanusia_phi.AAC.1
MKTSLSCSIAHSTTSSHCRGGRREEDSNLCLKEQTSRRSDPSAVGHRSQQLSRCPDTCDAGQRRRYIVNKPGELASYICKGSRETQESEEPHTNE